MISPTISTMYRFGYWFLKFSKTKNIEKFLWKKIDKIYSNSYLDNQRVKKMNKEITLRPLKSTDIDDFMVWASDDYVTRTVTWDTYKTKELATEFLENKVNKHPWFKAICLNRKPIGSISLNKGEGIYSSKAVLGYVLAKKYWGQGYTTQAVEKTKIVAFKDLSIKRIEAYVDPENVASWKV